MMPGQTIIREQESRGPIGKGLEIGEQLLKIGGLLAVFGYIATRAHLARLGITAASPLGTERYLAEFYGMFGDIFERAMLLTLILGPTILIFTSLFGSLTSNRSPAMELFVKRIRAASRHPLVPALVLLILVVCALRLLQIMSNILDTSAVVGRLEAVRTTSTRGAELFEELFWTVVVSGFICWGLGMGLHETISTSTEAKSRDLWVVCRILTVLLAMNVPLLFGAFEDNTYFPRVLVTTEGFPATCGLLVLETSSDFRIWQASGSVGKLLVIPESSVKSLVAGGSADLIALAERASAGGKIEDCPQ